MLDSGAKKRAGEKRCGEWESDGSSVNNDGGEGEQTDKEGRRRRGSVKW